jgi:arylesterase/paraoxonase
MKKLSSQIALVPLVLVAGFILLTLIRFGAFRSFDEKPGLGFFIQGIAGPEDLTIDFETGYLYVSSDDRRARLNDRPKQGGIYRLDAGQDVPEFRKISPDLDFEFYPHGISLYRAALGIKRLFVINHRSSGHFIEIFDVKDSGLVHLESISSPELYSPNDIVAVGLRQFYFTNDHGPEMGFSRLLGDLLRKGTASVGYFDGNAFRIVESGLNYANGINLSADGNYLLVAETTGKKITAYEREFVSGKLKKLHEKKLNTGADNIELSEDGTILLACHPNMLAFIRHASNPSRYSPSQVLSLKFIPEEGFYDVREVLTESGKHFSGSSTAARFDNRMFVGNVFEPLIWVVELD